MSKEKKDWIYVVALSLVMVSIVFVVGLSDPNDAQLSLLKEVLIYVGAAMTAVLAIKHYPRGSK